MHELQSLFPTQFNGHGFRIRDERKDYAELAEGPLIRPRLTVVHSYQGDRETLNLLSREGSQNVTALTYSTGTTKG